VPDERSLAAAVSLYLDQPDLRRAAGDAALALIRDNHGALDRTLEAMSRQLTATASQSAPSAAVAESRA
jgi:3-deoxy-D-manno-octulosonic-acid transferase